LILGSDGTYRVPSGPFAECPAGRTIPDEVGIVIPNRQRRLVLEPENMDELLAAVATCIGEVNPFRRYRAHVRLSRDGATLDGKATVSGRVRGRVPVRVKAIARVTGTLESNGLGPPAASRRTLQICSPSLAPRCRTQ
jgi:hypothetical protein